MHFFLIGLCAYVGLMVGIIIGGILGSQKPILSFIQDWQTLIAAAVAFAGIGIAWFSVGRQPRVTLISREEDRIERVLPGLYDASALLKGLVKGMNDLNLEERDAVDEFLNIYIPKREKENLETAIKRMLELADRPTQVRAFELLRELEWRAEFLVSAHKKFHAAEIAIEENPSNTTSILILDRAQKRLNNSNANFDEVLKKVSDFAIEIDEKIKVYSERLPKLRAEIETFFGDG